MGRFISPDRLDYLEPETLGGLNLYSYCNNNPVNYYDPSGHVVLTTLILGLIIGAIAGAIIGGTIAAVIASSLGATGWELFGWIMLGVFGGGLIGAGLGAMFGAAIGAIFPSINAALANGLSITIPALTNLGGVLGGAASTVAVPSFVLVGGAVAAGVAVGALGNVFFTKTTRLSDKKKSSDKPSWVNKGMVDPDLTAQQNATNMLDNKYGKGNWKTGPKSEFNRIVKWLIRSIFYRG